jgi:hypothetical protein
MAVYGLYLSILLFSNSLAEILLYIGVVYSFMQWFTLKKLPGRNRVLLRTILAIFVSALAYAGFHFSYPAPWNTGTMMLIMLPIGILVAFAYTVTRSIAATVIFNNILVVAGYLLTGTFFTESVTLGLVFNAISIFAVGMILILIGIYDDEL